MEKNWIGLISLLLVLAACTPAYNQTDAMDAPTLSMPTPDAPTETIVLDPIHKTAIGQLAASLGIADGGISVVGDENVEFADSCMDVPMPGIKCAQVPVPGRIILLEADHVQYEYHVREQGLVIQPASRALVWERDGGPAGFCDSMVVFLSGEVYGSRCNGDPDRAISTFANLLSADERRRFNSWMQEFGLVDLDGSDPESVADRMGMTATLYGNGTGELDKTEEQELLLWMENLFQKLYP